jgi:hypothetical protein
MLLVLGDVRAAARRGARRSSAVFIVTGLLFAAPPALGASASSCTASEHRCAPAAGDRASSAKAEPVAADPPFADANTSSSKPDAVAVDPPASQPRPPKPQSHPGTDPTPSSAGGTQTSPPPPDPGGAGSRHLPSGGGRHHPRDDSPSAGSRGRSAATSAGGFPDGPAPVDLLGPSLEPASVDRPEGLPHVAAVRSPRERLTRPVDVTRTVGQVADALRFPVALLCVILLFLAFEQRADSRDPKLAKAPIASREETLEFR